MALLLSPDEEAIQAGVRTVCQGRFSMEQVRALEAKGGVDAPSWNALVETGVFSLRQPVEAGGLGLGLSVAAVVFEQLGAALVPGPLVATELAATLDGTPIGPDQVVGLVEVGPGEAIVRHLLSLDHLLVLDADGVRLVDPAGIEGAAVPRPLDPLTPLHVVRDLPLGDEVGGSELAARLRLEGATLTAALLAGSAQAALDLALAYAKERHQFNRPIGSFQAVKHLLADMQVRAAIAQAAVYAAGAHLDDGMDEPERAVAAAKIAATEAAIQNGKDGIQVHGGMGFTWEVDAHLHYKRAWSLDPAFGTAAEHAERYATSL